MSDKDFPRVCANCKWAVIDCNEVSCHRYPPNSWDTSDGMILPNMFPVLVTDCWCGEFAVTGNRQLRYDLPFPEYQKVDA